jgi:hypothetical protein
VRTIPSLIELLGVGSSVKSRVPDLTNKEYGAIPQNHQTFVFY